MSGQFTGKIQQNFYRGGTAPVKKFEPARGRLNSQSSRGSSESSSRDTSLFQKYKNPEKPEALIERNRKVRGYDIDRMIYRAGLDCPPAVKEGLWDIGLVQAQKLFETCANSLADPIQETDEPDADLEEQLAASSTSMTKKLV